MSTVTRPPQAEIDEFFDENVARFVKVLQSVESRAGDAADVDPALLQELADAFFQSADDCLALEQRINGDATLLKETQERFRDAIAPWFDQSWFMHRAKSKPRGFVGDYEILTGIYDHQPKSIGIGRYLDMIFLETDLAKAVRTRLAAVQKFLLREVVRRTTPISILNIASGPGREYSSEFQSSSQPIHLTCLDTDEGALEYLRDHIDPSAKKVMDVNCVQGNALKTTSAKSNREQFGTPDIIYSVGLSDYIPDRYLIKILRGWYESVAEGGAVYVAFKDCRRYRTAEYQWHVDWYFYQRTEEDCRALFEQAGYDLDRLEMTRDESGVIMNFVIRKPVGAFKSDAAQQRVPAPAFIRHQVVDESKIPQED